MRGMQTIPITKIETLQSHTPKGEWQSPPISELKSMAKGRTIDEFVDCLIWRCGIDQFYTGIEARRVAIEYAIRIIKGQLSNTDSQSPKGSNKRG